MKTTFTIGSGDAGARLDVFLAGRLGGFSRAKVQKLIKSGAVLLNGRTAKPHAELADGDRVEAEADAPRKAEEGLEPRPDIPLAVVHEDADVVVVMKPAGMLVHPAVAGDRGTLANALLGRYPEIAGIGDDPTRPGIVHRLDKDASGLLVAARSAKAFASLKAQFQAHAVTKEYAVLVDGGPPHDSGTITFAIGRSASGGRMAARPEPGEDDKEAVTHYRVDERLPDVALLTVRTETGRTHQIRAHMHALGCPVVGDALYGAKRAKRLASPRLFLHAKALAFNHPVSGARLEFTAPLPKELEEVLAKARAKG